MIKVWLEMSQDEADALNTSTSIASVMDAEAVNMEIYVVQPQLERIKARFSQIPELRDTSGKNEQWKIDLAEYSRQHNADATIDDLCRTLHCSAQRARKGEPRDMVRDALEAVRRKWLGDYSAVDLTRDYVSVIPASAPQPDSGSDTQTAPSQGPAPTPAPAGSTTVAQSPWIGALMQPRADQQPFNGLRHTQALELIGAWLACDENSSKQMENDLNALQSSHNTAT